MIIFLLKYISSICLIISVAYGNSFLNSVHRKIVDFLFSFSIFSPIVLIITPRNNKFCGNLISSKYFLRFILTSRSCSINASVFVIENRSIDVC